MLQWSEQFETGHALIDTQHKMLISYINRLEGMALTTNPNRREIEFFLQLVSFMDAYIAVHFKHEEECMASHKCPAYKENQAAHPEFLLFFRKFKLRFETEGFRPEVVKELHESCDAWIQHHIMQIDVQLRPCLSRQASPENQG